MTALLDTGLLLAVLDASDDLHEICLFRPQHCAVFEISP